MVNNYSLSVFLSTKNSILWEKKQKNNPATSGCNSSTYAFAWYMFHTQHKDFYATPEFATHNLKKMCAQGNNLVN